MTAAALRKTGFSDLSESLSCTVNGVVHHAPTHFLPHDLCQKSPQPFGIVPYWPDRQTANTALLVEPIAMIIAS